MHGATKPNPVFYVAHVLSSAELLVLENVNYLLFFLLLAFWYVTLAWLFPATITFFLGVMILIAAIMVSTTCISCCDERRSRHFLLDRAF